ncbi:unnamed protein product [Ceratitis capitata]|uniref:(Mediterranean fruit fly) hypothetical protein n=1 Tax=Ceratitis capitata TaxID=7213 RepID=A0A811UYQ1_CERCA|nr:unnamed protein product [Ceratitis capitata]
MNPLIFVEVALMNKIADSIQYLLDESTPSSDPSNANTAIFYSISNTQTGLSGISLAHIDHGKSTLADRLIEWCNALEAREMTNQVLDSMEIERKRGITIKAQTVKLSYTANDGHVDFSYEVSRSLAACEGSLLIVDSSQGIEAQTLANVYRAIENNHEIIVVLNKVDLPAADPEMVKLQIGEVIGIDTSNSILISAKTGLGIRDVLEAIVTKLPAPRGDIMLRYKQF